MSAPATAESNLSRLLTAHEVARMLGESTHSVYRMARLGVLPHVRWGTRGVRFCADERARWQRGAENHPPEDSSE